MDSMASILERSNRAFSRAMSPHSSCHVIDAGFGPTRRSTPCTITCARVRESVNVSVHVSVHVSVRVSVSARVSVNA